jgi:peptide/nickel transport system permease protein
MRIIGFRLLHLLVVLFLVSVSSLLLMDIAKGDPALNLLGPEATDEQIATIRDQLNLDKSLPERYIIWIGDALRGDLGRSYLTKVPVTEEIAARAPVNLQLAAMSLMVSLVLAIPLGAFLAYRRDSRTDRVARGVTSLMLSSPSFLTASVLVYFLAVQFRWFPVSGWTSVSDGLGDNLRRLAIPVFSLAVVEVAQFARLLRADMVDTLDQDHVLAARAIGLPSRTILFRYAFRPSSFSLLTVATIGLGRLIGGSVIMELIFSLPGLGTYMVRAVTGKDLQVIQGVSLFVGTVYVLVNMTVALLYAWLDPRIRSSRAV